MSFYACWKAFYGDRSPSERRKKAEKAYVKAEADGHDLRGFLVYVQELDKTGRDFCGSLVSFLMGLDDIPVVTPPAVKPVTPVVVAPAKPSIPAPRPTVKPATIASKFDDLWRRWPSNINRPEPVERATAAWDAAVRDHGEEWVARIAEKILKSEKQASLPRYLSTVLRDVLPNYIAEGYGPSGRGQTCDVCKAQPCAQGLLVCNGCLPPPAPGDALIDTLMAEYLAAEPAPVTMAPSKRIDYERPSHQSADQRLDEGIAKMLAEENVKGLQ